VWHNVPTTIEFSGAHKIHQFDFVYFTPSNKDCGLAPYPEDLSGFLDANLRTTIRLSAGTYMLCLRQGPTPPSKHDIHAVAVYKPPSLPPQPPPFPSSPPNPPHHPPPKWPPLAPVSKGQEYGKYFAKVAEAFTLDLTSVSTANIQLALEIRTAKIASLAGVSVLDVTAVQTEFNTNSSVRRLSEVKAIDTSGCTGGGLAFEFVVATEDEAVRDAFMEALLETAATASTMEVGIEVAQICVPITLLDIGRQTTVALPSPPSPNHPPSPPLHDNFDYDTLFIYGISSVYGIVIFAIVCFATFTLANSRKSIFTLESDVSTKPMFDHFPALTFAPTKTL
jgi:hypothetical protein